MKILTLLSFLIIATTSHGKNAFPNPFSIHGLKKENISTLTCSVESKCSIRCMNIDNNNIVLELNNVTSAIYAANEYRHFYFANRKRDKRSAKTFTHFPLDRISCALMGLVNKK